MVNLDMGYGFSIREELEAQKGFCLKNQISIPPSNFKRFHKMKDRAIVVLTIFQKLTVLNMKFCVKCLNHILASFLIV